MKTKGDSEKLFGKWNELVLLFIGFVLTVIVGGLISTLIQNRTWDHQNSEIIKKEEIENAQKVFEEISSLIDSRMYLTRRLVWGHIRKINKDEIEKRFTRYDEMLYDWNLSLNKRQSLIKRYFGPLQRESFEFQIHDKFRIISQELDSLIRVNSKSPNEYVKIQEKLDQINDMIYGYNITLLNQIKKGQVGKLLDMNNLRQERVVHYNYLLKRGITYINMFNLNILILICLLLITCIILILRIIFRKK